MKIKVLLLSIIISLLFTECAPKRNCGTKRQHRQRYVKMRQFAPGMAY